jgi:site-specific recombinase XerD
MWNFHWFGVVIMLRQDIEDNKKRYFRDRKAEGKFDDTTLDNYRKELNKLIKYECDLNKDFFMFTQKDMDQLFERIIPTKKPKAFISNISKYRDYLEWAIAKGLTKQKVNFKKYNRDYVMNLSNKNIVIPFARLEEILNSPKIHNAQDAVILALLFEGVDGKGHKEVVGLKQLDDVTESTIKIRNEQGVVQREILVRKKTIDLIQKASSQEDYYYVNSKSEPIIKNDYVLRVPGTDRDVTSPISPVTINTRLRKIGIDIFGSPELQNPYNFSNSGLLFYLMVVEKHLGQNLTKEHYYKVAKRFKAKPGKGFKFNIEQKYKDYKKRNLVSVTDITLDEELKEIAESILETELTEQDLKELKLLANNDNHEDDEHDEDDEDDDWVQEDKERGTKGENFVLSELIKTYGESNVKLKSGKDDSAGYDIKVTLPDQVLRIEVKTTTSIRNPFYISIRQLKRAKRYKEQYYIYWVLMDKKDNPLYALVIPNPIETLNINLDFIFRKEKNKFVRIKPNKFVFYVNRSMAKVLTKFPSSSS